MVRVLSLSLLLLLLLLWHDSNGEDTAYGAIDRPTAESQSLLDL